MNHPVVYAERAHKLNKLMLSHLSCMCGARDNHVNHRPGKQPSYMELRSAVLVITEYNYN